MVAPDTTLPVYWTRLILRRTGHALTPWMRTNYRPHYRPTSGAQMLIAEQK